MVLYAGFLLGTLCCALAPDYRTLVAARFVTGAFGGILGGMSMAIIGDVFPEDRRGRATGSLMTGFALASVAGVPLGLYLGTEYGWHVPFVVLALAGSPALFAAPFALPRLDGHVGKRHVHPLRSMVETFSHANHLKAFRADRPVDDRKLYGLSVSAVVSRAKRRHAGIAIAVGLRRRWRAHAVCGSDLRQTGGPIWQADCLPRADSDLGGLARRDYALATFAAVYVALVVFGLLMVCNVGRMIAAMAMVTSSVEPQRRGAFLSANASVQHIASGFGAYLGGMIVTEAADGKIEHFGTVGWVAAAATLSTVWIASRIRVADQTPVSAEAMSFAAAAEATVDAGEPMFGYGDITHG